MNELEEFRSPVFGTVRTAEIDGKPYFVGKDVAQALGYANTNDALNKHCRGVAKRYPITDSLGRIQEVRIISEGDMYRLIASSKLESAQKFESWIFDDVVPTIRKHGAYATPATIESIIANPDNGIRLLQALKEEQEKRKALEAQNEEMKPKALFADAVSASDDCILMRDLAKLIKQNGVDIGGNRLWDWMREHEYICKGSTQPTQLAMDMGLFHVIERTIQVSDGSPRIKPTTKVTGKGQQYFINKFLGENHGE